MIQKYQIKIPIITIILTLIKISKSQDQCYEDSSDSFCLPQPEKIVKKESLFFVTPWNKIGYEHVMNHASKIDYVSPTWFYIEKNKTTNVYEFQGRQDIKPNFIKKIKEFNPFLKILPRFYISADRDEFKWALKKKNREFLFNELKRIAEEYSFDGFVFDIPLLNYVKYRTAVKEFLEILEFEFEKFTRFITFSGTRIQITKDLEEIRPYTKIFHKIIVCTYNYPRGWLSPLPWVQENINYYQGVAKELDLEENFFMLGIQFYGYIEDLKVMSRRELKVDE